MIIIDESSMVGNRMLQYIHQRLQQITVSRKLFDGISCCWGLISIKTGFWWMDFWKTKRRLWTFGFISSKWRDNFQVNNLNEIMCQKKLKEFTCILNRIRAWKHTKKDIDVLRTTMISKNEQSIINWKTFYNSKINTAWTPILKLKRAFMVGR